MDIQERGTRYADLLPLKNVEQLHVGVIGVGGLGYPIVRALASIGVGHMELFDPDRVEVVNLGTQGWCQDHVGLWKVEAAAQEAQRLNKSVSIGQHRETFEENMIVPWDLTFVCVDSMKARKDVVTAFSRKRYDYPRTLVEGRMGAEAFEFHILQTLNDVERWRREYWFPDSEAVREPCTRRATMWCGVSTGALMAGYGLKAHFGILKIKDLVGCWISGFCRAVWESDVEASEMAEAISE